MKNNQYTANFHPNDNQIIPESIPDALRDFFAQHSKIALAFSGGVDSSYLLYAASALGCDVTAYCARSQFQPAFELKEAQLLADQLNTRLVFLDLDALADPRIAANPADRCYYCKHRIFGRILEAARADGYEVLIDGTNASDDAEDRPGMRALQELKVLSPLRICQIPKKEVRRLSKIAGLFTWDKPAYACLATRIPTDTSITAGDLHRVEKAEAALMAMGFSDLRVRLMGSTAKLQLPLDQMSKAAERAQEITEELVLYFEAVLLDLKPRN